MIKEKQGNKFKGWDLKNIKFPNHDIAQIDLFCWLPYDSDVVLLSMY